MIQNTKGFTLIELLVVIAIVGILSMISIYQYAYFREGSFCARVESDVHNTVSALESRYAAFYTYAGVSAIQTQSNGIVINVSATDDQITNVKGNHPRCKKGDFTFDPLVNPTFQWLP